MGAEEHRLSAPEGSAFEAFFRAAEAGRWVYAGAISGGQGGKWQCPNPDHHDEHASLDVHAGSGAKAGKPVATCTPCREAMGQKLYWELLVSLGAEFRGAACPADSIDWGPAAENRSGSGGSGAKGKTDYALKAAYNYNHFDGSPNFKVRRLEDRNGIGRKTFSPQRWDDDRAEYRGGVGALDNVLRTPLYFERFEDWGNEFEYIYLCEGEKAASRIVAAGKAATCFHGGTAGKRMDDYEAVFKRHFKAVRVWTDLDEAGLGWAVKVRDELNRALVPTDVWCNSEGAAWVAKGDAFEQIEFGGSPRKVTKELAAEIRALHPMPVAPTRVIANDRPDANSREIVIGVTDINRGLVPFNPNQNPVSAAKWWLAHVGVPIVTQGSDVFFEWVGDHYRPMTADEMDKVQREFWNGRETPAADPTAPPLVVKVKKGTVGELRSALGSASLVTVLDDPTAYVPGMAKVPVMQTAKAGVPFKNGWLDIETGELTEHSTDRFVTWRINADYTGGAWDRADSPLFVKFLESLGWTEETEEYRLLRQMFGLVLAGDQRIHKAFMLIGPPRAGKGTILKLLKALVGSGTVGFDIGQLDEEFALQNFLGKSLAIDDDARFDHSKRTVGRLLRITSFGESDVNVKNKARLSVVLPTRIVVATNEPPKFREASKAIATRFVPLKFTKSFLGAEDPDLDAKLAREVAGVAKWAIGGYVDVRSLGWRLSETTVGSEIIEDIAHRSSSVRLFVDEECEVSSARDARGTPVFTVHLGDLFTMYQSWAVQGDYFKLSRSEFISELMTAFPNVNKDKGRVARASGASANGYRITGLRLRKMGR